LAVLPIRVLAALKIVAALACSVKTYTEARLVQRRLSAQNPIARNGQAWQGLYAALLAGEEISNVAAWLVIVTFRRAIDEQRTRMRERGERHGDPEHLSSFARGSVWERVQERDLAAELDDRVTLRQLFEGLRGRLDAREREAAVLCYLQGLSRSEAAARMGISEVRMRKLMEGRGAGRPGVARKVGMLVETVGAGAWCEEQGSLMRGLAYGVLDPTGDRYRLAVMHRSECSACRAYVVSLRGLAAALPPVLLPSGLGGAGLVLAGAGARGGLRAAGGVGASAGVGASGVGGAGAVAGGGWLLAGGPLGAKLAVGCLLAIGVGAGCVALEGAPDHARAPLRRHATTSGWGVRERLAEPGMPSRLIGAGPGGGSVASLRPGSAAVGEVAAGGAGREFGPEHAPSPGSRPLAASVVRGAPSARSASAALEAAAYPRPGAMVQAPAPASGAGQPSTASASAGASAAAHEFAPG
jgi:RNA polymerase sigma factor (sigma-70 family)